VGRRFDSSISIPRLLLVISILIAAPIWAQAPDQTGADTARAVTIAPPTSVVVEDFDYDDGTGLELFWVPSIDDKLKDSEVLGYRVYRSTEGGPPELLAELPAQSNNFLDDRVMRDSTYTYTVAAVGPNGEAEAPPTAPVSPEREWINWNLGWLFLIAVVIGGAVILFITAARRGVDLYVRRIAGLEAVDEAIGRATEMGRSILFIPGIHDMDDVQTLAGITILGRVAQQVADYDTKIRMPVSRSLVMTAARETIKTAYQTAGRPDAYSDDMVSYVTDEQFGYVAAVDGIMVREKPATVFLVGAFFAESLILAETGNSVGAIQIAGTARPAQLPFFIAACDFTLIGEELFAASAYLSGEPKQLGSLKGQDVGKAMAMVIIFVGVIAMTIGQAWDVGWATWLYDSLEKIFSVK
jgi:hypothetical protein